MKKLLALLLLCSCTSPDPTYVAADRATFKAVAPEYLRYVEADPELTDAQKDRRKRTISSWDSRIKAAQK